MEANSRGLKDNYRLGDGEIVLAFAEMIKVMGWTSSQLDTNNIQIGNLTDELKLLSKDFKSYGASADKESQRMYWLTIVLGIVAVLQLLIAYGQYRLGEVQIDTARDQTSLQNGIWAYEQMRNDRLEGRDVQWRREDLEFQKRLPVY